MKKDFSFFCLLWILYDCSFEESLECNYRWSAYDSNVLNEFIFGIFLVESYFESDFYSYICLFEN